MSVAAQPVGIDLYWIPLGAGGNFVRLNGRVYTIIFTFVVIALSHV